MLKNSPELSKVYELSQSKSLSVIIYLSPSRDQQGQRETMKLYKSNYIYSQQKETIELLDVFKTFRTYPFKTYSIQVYPRQTRRNHIENF